MLYIIGLGLNEKGISKDGLDVVKRSKKIYLENYTVDFPYSFQQLEEVIGKKVVLANREFVEGLEIIDEARKKDVVLLVYGSPLSATTHITLIDEAKKSGVKYAVIYSSSVIDAVAETGLQLYKFGKITSMPKWDEEKKFTPTSFIDIVFENKKINAHTLILVDIGLEFDKAIQQFIKASEGKIKIGKVLVCSRLGTRHKKFYYDFIENLKNKEILAPYSFIIPGKLHFSESEFLEGI